MPMKSFFLIAAIMAAMAVMWASGVGQNQASENLLARQKLDEMEGPRPTTATPAKAKPRAVAQATGQTLATSTPASAQNLQQLQARLKDARQKLEARNQVLEDLKRRREQTPRAVNVTAQIEKRDTEIQNLMDLLRSYHREEQDLNRSADQAMDQQDVVAARAREQVDLQIQNLQQDIHKSETEMRAIQSRPPWADANQRRLDTEALQTRLNDQKAQLQTLRGQRAQIADQVVQGSRNNQALVEQARLELRSSANEVQARIFSLRNEVDQLENTHGQTEDKQEMLQSQIARAQKDVETQAREVESLQQQLQSQQSPSQGM